MAEKLGMEDSNYSSFLSGKRGISAEATCQLLELMSLTKEQAVAKFYKPMTTSKIMHLQGNSSTAMMQVDGNGWVPGVGIDPDSVGTDHPLGMLRQACISIPRPIWRHLGANSFCK